jgi:hypothetical protein
MRCSEAARSVVGLQRRGKRAWRRKPGKSEGRLRGGEGSENARGRARKEPNL